MQVNPKILKQKFEKSMPSYEKNAVVQEEMANILIDLLKTSSGKNFDNILELGSGTGLLTKLIINNLEYQNLICNDIVEKSKNYIQKFTNNFEFISGNSSKIKPNKQMDLIISNAMFQWFTSLDSVLEHHHKFLNKNGIIAFSSFTENNYKELRDKLNVTLNYLSEEEICAIVEKKFEILAVKSFERTLNFPTPLALLAHVKNTGVNSLNNGKINFSQIKTFCATFDTQNNCNLTYEPIIVIARKKSPRKFRDKERKRNF